jgi:3-dehydroquinate synthase
MASKVLVEDILGLSLESPAVAWIAQPGAGAAILIVSLLALDVFLPVPSSLVMVLSGAAFGVPAGAALALVGSVAGEWLGFELVRRYGRRMSARLVGDDELDRFSRFFAQHGVAAIIVTRPLPVVMETMSLVAGLSRMRRRAFLAASIAGTAPIVVVYAYAGAVSREVGSVLPAVVMLIAVTGAAWIWFRTRTQHEA